MNDVNINRLKIGPVTWTFEGLRVSKSAAFVVVAFAWVLHILAIAFGIYVLVINIMDIDAVGANFWNITWIVLAALWLLGSLRSAD